MINLKAKPKIPHKWNKMQIWPINFCISHCLLSAFIPGETLCGRAAQKETIETIFARREVN